MSMGEQETTRRDLHPNASLQGAKFLLGPSTTPPPRFGFSGLFEWFLFSWLHFEGRIKEIKAMDDICVGEGFLVKLGVTEDTEHQLLVENLGWCLAFIVILCS